MSEHIQGHAKSTSPHVRESGFQNPGAWKFLLVESGIQLKESEIPLTIGIRNPSSTEKDLEPSTWNLESEAWNPESMTVLDSLTWGDQHLQP